MFAASRALYAWLGVRFNDWPLGVYWQYLDPFLLRRKLGESLLHLHGQPPLFNLYLGAALATGHERAVFIATFLFSGLAVYAGTFLLMRRLGVASSLAFPLATWLATAPAFVAYENWLFYSLPLAALLVRAALAFDRAVRTGRTRDGVLFLAILSLVCGARSLYHLVYLLAALSLLAVAWRDPRRAIAAGAVPLLLVTAIYVKNKVLFGHFAASTWTGMNLARLTTDALPPVEAQRLVAAGTLSPASLVPAFSRSRAYPRAYFDPPPASRVRALYWEEKTTGGANFNHGAYVRISDDLLGDAAWVIRHRPRTYLASVREAWSIYFRSPGDLRFLGAENIGVLRPASDFYDVAFFGRRPGPGSDRDLRAPARYWGLMVGLPIAFGVGLAATLGRGPGRHLDRRQRLLAAFLCFNIAFVAVVGNFLELGENNRFRFETDPMSLCLLGLGLQVGIAFVPASRVALVSAAELGRVLHADLLLQLALATVLGGIIGFERELKGKPAGLRTNILICIGAATFTHLSIQMGAGTGDPGRIAAQVLTGVGFIGAGTILHSHGSVTGLTSAATIWVVSAIGMTLGMALYVEAIGTTAVVMTVLAGLARVEVVIGRHVSTSRLMIRAKPEPSPVEDLRTVVGRTGLEVVRADVRGGDQDLVIEMEVRGPRRLHEQALVALVHHSSVRSVSTGE